MSSAIPDLSSQRPKTRTWIKIRSIIAFGEVRGHLEPLTIAFGFTIHVFGPRSQGIAMALDLPGRNSAGHGGFGLASASHASTSAASLALPSPAARRPSRARPASSSARARVPRADGGRPDRERTLGEREGLVGLAERVGDEREVVEGSGEVGVAGRERGAAAAAPPRRLAWPRRRGSGTRRPAPGRAPHSGPNTTSVARRST